MSAPGAHNFRLLENNGFAAATSATVTAFRP
jgi:hypothetical protein